MLIRGRWTSNVYFFFFFFNDTTTTEIYTLSLHDALPISAGHGGVFDIVVEHRCRIDAVMAQASQRAVALRAERDRLNGRRLVAHHGVHLRAGELQENRPV